MKKSTTVFLAAGLLAVLGLSARRRDDPAPVATEGDDDPGNDQTVRR
ncbi:MAG: hypothetical protein IPH91_09635 [Elusimicrobia bacterium]|nr:hypothetical protein [Elusimicrobiota bacterium]